VKVPRSRISRAASRKPDQAARASAPPTLIRRTPRSASSATVEKPLPTHVDRFGGDRCDHRRDLLPRADPGRIEAVGAGLGIGGESPDRLVEIGAPDDEPLGPTGEEHADPLGVDGPARRPDALDGEGKIEQRARGIAGRVLDRQPRYARLDGGRHVGRHALGRDREPAFEVAVDRHVHRVRDGTEVGERLFERHVVVGAADGPGESRARRGEGRKPELHEGLRAADVPRVGDDEAAGCVKLAERRDMIDGANHAARAEPSPAARPVAQPQRKL
jgi:hypothetical protein